MRERETERERERETERERERERERDRGEQGEKREGESLLSSLSHPSLHPRSTTRRSQLISSSSNRTSVVTRRQRPRIQPQTHPQCDRRGSRDDPAAGSIRRPWHRETPRRPRPRSKSSKRPVRGQPRLPKQKSWPPPRRPRPGNACGSPSWTYSSLAHFESGGRRQGLTAEERTHETRSDGSVIIDRLVRIFRRNARPIKFRHHLRLVCTAQINREDDALPVIRPPHLAPVPLPPATCHGPPFCSKPKIPLPKCAEPHQHQSAAKSPATTTLPPPP